MIDSSSSSSSSFPRPPVAVTHAARTWKVLLVKQVCFRFQFDPPPPFTIGRYRSRGAINQSADDFFDRNHHHRRSPLLFLSMERAMSSISIMGAVYSVPFFHKPHDGVVVD